MAKGVITKPTAAAVIYPINHRATFDDITIQNNTTDTITITVTAMNVQTETPVWSTPAAGALTIAAAAVGVLLQPVTAIQISGTGTGKVHIVEAY